jgi:hypothetical protein
VAGIARASSPRGDLRLGLRVCNLCNSRDMRRPLHALTFVGALAHHAFELSRGVGLVFQPELGLIGASTFWGIVFPCSILISARRSSRWDRLLAFSVGANLAAALLHFTLWPWDMRKGLPTLVDAEGLEPQDLPAYNAILHLWSIAAIAAIAVEVPRGLRGTALAGFLFTTPFRRHARNHFEWIAEQARENPAWWNRALHHDHQRLVAR